MTDEAVAVLTEARDLVTQARGYQVGTPDEYQAVACFLLGVKALRARIGETFDPHIKRAFEAHRALCAEKRVAEAEALEAETIAKRLLVAYDAAQEAVAAEQRIAAERARVAALEAAQTEAEALDGAGEYAAADAVLARARAVASVPVLEAPRRPVVDGIALRESWSARVVNLGALVRAAAARPEWIGLLKADTAALNAQARSLRERMNIPGVEAVSSRGVAVRAGAAARGDE